MIKRMELEKYLGKEIYKITFDTKKSQEICDYNCDTYNIPRTITSDYITLRNPLSEANDFILFCLLDSIEKINQKNKSVIGEYYLEKEIKKYSVSRMEDNNIKFPIRFKAIQITDDQWIASIDFKMLMKLRAAQLIIYDENTQRTMKKIVRGDNEIYVIDINNYAVNKIKELYQNGNYIPTPLTLNIPLDTEYDFYYDENSCELVIKSLEAFDIVDGYHRYLAACKACDSDKNFNFKMELRIINFPDDKAQQFIYQEDQKTVMSKANSNTYDQTNLANRIVDGLNTKSQSNLQGLIGRNQANISYGELSELIKYFYLNNVKNKDNKVFISVLNQLMNNFNMITEYNTKYLENKITFKQLFVMMYCFRNYAEKINVCQMIEEIIEKLKNSDIKFSSKATGKKAMINEVERVIKEVSDYV